MLNRDHGGLYLHNFVRLLRRIRHEAAPKKTALTSSRFVDYGVSYLVSIQDGVADVEPLDPGVALELVKNFNLTEGGAAQLLRHRGPAGKSFQIYRGSGHLRDDAELTQLLHYYGSRQTLPPSTTILEAVSVKRQPLTCGPASRLVKEVLNQFGHEARVVTSLRLGGFNAFDNGHTVLEVFSKDLGWHLFDPSYGGWLKQGNRFLSAIELHGAISRGEDFRFVPVAFRNFGEFSGAEGVNLGFDLEMKWFFPQRTVRWYRDIFEVFGIEEGSRPGHYFFLADSADEAQIVENYSSTFHAISRPEFESKYYRKS